MNLKPYVPPSTGPVKYRDIPHAFYQPTDREKTHAVALLIVRAIDNGQTRIAQQIAARLAAETSDKE